MQSTKYFDVYKQVKEEMKQNNSGRNTKNKNLNRNQLLYNLYLKNAKQIDNYIENNYPNITLEGTKNLDGLQKKDLANEIKNNQSHWREMNQGLKYRNPELNKNCEQLNLTPIPINKDIDQMNEYQKNEFEKAKKNAVFMRKMEYRHAKPIPITEEYINNKKRKEMIFKYMTINKIKIIQRWYRKYSNIKKEKELLKNKNKTPYYDDNDIYALWEEQNKKDQEKFIQYTNSLNKLNKDKIENSISNNENNNDNKNINDNIIDNYNENNSNSINYDDKVNINNKANDNEDNLNFDDNINNIKYKNINDNTNNYNYINNNIPDNNSNYNIDNKINSLINSDNNIINNINNNNNYNDEIDNNFNNNNKNYNNNNIQTENSFYISGNKPKYFDNSKTQFDDLEQINILPNTKTNIFKTQNNSPFNYYETINNNSNKNKYFNQLYPERKNSFDIINNNQDNDIYNTDYYNNLEIKSKPILNDCFLSKDIIILSCESYDIPKLRFIQRTAKLFLKNKKTKLNNNNNYSNYTNYNKDKNNNIKLTPNNINNSNNSLSGSLNKMNDIKNNSLNKSYGRNRMISELDSLQFYHNLTINKDGEIFFDNIIGNENEDNLSINKEKSINKNILKAKKNINNNSNLLSFSSENDNNNNNNSYNNNSNIINYKNNII